jgi:hypothetical protein
MRLALLLGLTVALAGCGRASDQPKETPKATPAPFVNGGWATVFGDAPETVSLLDRMGFRMSSIARSRKPRRWPIRRCRRSTWPI